MFPIYSKLANKRSRAANRSGKLENSPATLEAQANGGGVKREAENSSVDSEPVEKKARHISPGDAEENSDDAVPSPSNSPPAGSPRPELKLFAGDYFGSLDVGIVDDASENTSDTSEEGSY